MVNTSVGVGGSTEFRIGSVISQSLGVLLGEPIKYIGISALALVPSLANYSLFGNNPANTFSSVSGVIFWLLGIVVAFLVQAIVTYGAFETLRGQTFNVQHAISENIGRILVLVGLAIVFSIGMGIGFVLLIVPGFILLCMWFVAVPGCVVEKQGITASLGRSRSLTAGYRWKIFGLILITYVPLILLSFLLSALFLRTGAIGTYMILISIVQLITGAFFTILGAVTYFQLRNVKEGLTLDKLASVFD